MEKISQKNALAKSLSVVRGALIPRPIHHAHCANDAASKIDKSLRRQPNNRSNGKCDSTQMRFKTFHTAVIWPFTQTMRDVLLIIGSLQPLLAP